jgi:hypothetical protein
MAGSSDPTSFGTFSGSIDTNADHLAPHVVMVLNPNDVLLGRGSRVMQYGESAQDRYETSL